MNRQESAHIKKIGQAKYDRAFLLATIEIHKDSHFVGLNKVRNAIVRAVALRATGYKSAVVRFGRGVVAPPDTVSICDELFRHTAKTVEAGIQHEHGK